MNRRILIALASTAAAASALVVAVAPARGAGTATSTVTVTATVAKSCAMTNTTLAFGAYDPNSVAALDQSATFTLSCTKGTTATIGLNTGVNGARNMKGAALPNDLLSYQLFQDTTRTTAWDTTTTLAVSSSTGAANTLTVYGRIPVAQFVTADSYSDTVTATVNF